MKKSIAPAQTIVPTTDPQKDQYFRVIEDIARVVFNKASPTKEQIQDLIESGGKLKREIAPIIERFLLKNHYHMEEGRYSYYYPPSYVEATPIKQQIEFLVKEFGLNGEKALRRISEITRRRDEYEWFAVPRYQLLVPNEPNYEIRYCKAVQMILDKIGKSRKLFQSFGEVDHYHLKMSEKTLEGLARLEQEQFASDILVFPAQLGAEYSGKSPARAIECFKKDEYGVSAFFGGIFALTNPPRFSYDGDLTLSMLCIGDETENQFSSTKRVPLFSFFFNELGFDTTSFHEYEDDCGQGNPFLCLGPASFLVPKE